MPAKLRQKYKELLQKRLRTERDSFLTTDDILDRLSDETGLPVALLDKFACQMKLKPAEKKIGRNADADVRRSQILDIYETFVETENTDKQAFYEQAAKVTGLSIKTLPHSARDLGLLKCNQLKMPTAQFAAAAPQQDEPAEELPSRLVLRSQPGDEADARYFARAMEMEMGMDMGGFGLQGRMPRTVRVRP